MPTPCLAALVPLTTSDGWTQWLAPSGTVAVAILLALLCVIAWASNLITLPGNWISVGLLAFYVWLGPDEGRAAIGWTALVAAVALALLGELVELAASVLGAKKAGASRRSTVYAVLGSMVGAVVGAAIGLPIPVIGSVLAAILFGGLGATLGAMYGQRTEGQQWKESLQVGHAAFWGRTFGTLGKFSVGFGIVMLVVIALLI